MDGIETALEALFASAFVPMRRAAYSVVRDWDESEELVQEAFAIAWARRREFRGEGSLNGWIWRILLRAAARRGAGMRRQRSLLDRLDPVLPPGERAPELLEAFALLPPRRRLLVVLHHVAGLTYDEIAEATGLRVGTVSGSLAKARVQLVEALQEKGVRP
jgi:RNA polymerase sigma-70 factor (ECF subfamily)